jgi:hypothetical protein
MLLTFASIFPDASRKITLKAVHIAAPRNAKMRTAIEPGSLEHLHPEGRKGDVSG